MSEGLQKGGLDNSRGLGVALDISPGVSGDRCSFVFAIRKVFNYHVWESVTDLQHALYRPTWEELIAKRQSGFLRRVSQCDILKVFQ